MKAQLALPAAPVVETLPAVSGHRPFRLKDQLSLGIIPGYVPTTFVPSSTYASDGYSPIEIGPAAVKCWRCHDGSQYDEKTDSWSWIPKVVYPQPMSDPAQGWITYPCHETECSACYGVVIDHDTCSRCEDCCNCPTCSSCGENCEETCSACDECESCCSCSSSPEWLTVRPMRTVNVHHELTELGRKVFDPAQVMADFYLCEYVLAVIPSHVSLHNGTASAARARVDAKRLQDSIIRMADDLFRLYVLAAVGGELRHHDSIKHSVSESREAFWDRFVSIAHEVGPIDLLRDAENAFRDGSWNGGYGGRNWAVAAATLRKREEGSLDAKTFVDRVFSLQHNSGSLLNKESWAEFNPRGWGTGEMVNIGEAHHKTDLETLLSVASTDVVGLLASLHSNLSWVLTTKGLDSVRRDLQTYAPVTGGEV